MKLSKKFSLGYILQIFAVILLFGYPGGCASFAGQKEIKAAEKGSLHENILSPDVHMNNITADNDSLILFEQPMPEEIKYSFFTTPVKSSINIKKNQVTDTW
jgi:hypothetical protein